MRETRPIPSQEYLSECFDYNPETGLLTWRIRPVSHYSVGGHSDAHLAARCNSQYAGKPALNAIKKTGYRMGALDRITRTAHRVIWKLVNGVDPIVVDHVNGNKADNRLCNLRNVDQRLNMRNLADSHKGSGGIRGVWRHRNGGGWQSHITDDSGAVLTMFSKHRDEAVAWRRAMEERLGYITREG